MKTHTGARPYTCICCDKAFSIKRSLKNHMMRVHDFEEQNDEDEQCMSVLDGPVILEEVTSMDDGEDGEVNGENEEEIDGIEEVQNDGEVIE